MFHYIEIVGTEYYLNHTSNNVRGSVVVCRPTAAWIAVNCLKNLRNTHAHLPSLKVSNTYHTEVFQSVRDAIEKLKVTEARHVLRMLTRNLMR